VSLHNLTSLLNRPLALHSREVEKIAAVLRGDLDTSALGFGGYADRARQYGLVEGVAIIPVQGVLTNEDYGGWWGTGYGWIRTGLVAALADPEVKAINFLVDSPGGVVAGCFDLVDTIYSARGVKPMWAILGEEAYSAAYAIASATDHITVPRTGGTGSVGVITMHADFSAALEKDGIKVSVFRYGARKAEGNPYEPLSEEAAAAIQADIDEMGDLFVSTVARNRGMDAKAVRDTQAATFLGEKGLGLGFADQVAAPDAAFRALLKSLV
jgi:signal peptide peptidase SppA